MRGMERGTEPPVTGDRGDRLRNVQSALHKLGYASARPARRALPEGADLWVERPGPLARRTAVYVEGPYGIPPEHAARQLAERWREGLRGSSAEIGPDAILVVGDDRAARAAAEGVLNLSPLPRPEAASRTRILVLPRETPGVSAHWHAMRLPPRELLIVATGTLIGIARRDGLEAGEEGSVALDIASMLTEMKQTLHLDVEGSLGVESEEDALFILYQLALRHTYAPGDQGGSLHSLAARPRNPAARLPWFAV
jgi:hypothetical protein